MFALRCAAGLALTVGVVGCVRAQTRPHAQKARTRVAHDAHADKAECVATYNGKCFASGDEACAYAGCADQRCEVIPTVPAQASCADLR